MRRVTVEELISMLNYPNDVERSRAMVRIIKCILDYQPIGLVLLECQTLDSSSLGRRTILPYGGKATLQEPPTGPISPTGLASDMSVPIAWAETCNY